MARRTRAKTYEPIKATAIRSRPEIERISQVTELLNEVARLLQRDPVIDSDALEHLRQLQLRLGYIAATSETPSELPSVAPTKWVQRENRSESPLDFIRRVYGPWLGKGFSRPHIRRLDPTLYSALAHWIVANGAIPSTLDLPTKKELNDRQLATLGSLFKDLPAQARELRRLEQLFRRRSTRKK